MKRRLLAPSAQSGVDGAYGLTSGLNVSPTTSA
jgi:hypothetical protein